MSSRTILDDKLDRSFDMLDADRDGHIREADLVALAAKLGTAFDIHEPGAIARLEGSFATLWKTDLKQMDADQNGAIDRVEWRSGVRQAVASDRAGFLGRMDTMLQSWLELCDTDGDGLISRAEFITMYGRTLDLSPEQLAAAFTTLDTDGDGSLSKDEIRSAVEQYYTSEDPGAPGNSLFGPL